MCCWYHLGLCIGKCKQLIALDAHECAFGFKVCNFILLQQQLVEIYFRRSDKRLVVYMITPRSSLKLLKVVIDPGAKHFHYLDCWLG